MEIEPEFDKVFPNKQNGALELYFKDGSTKHFYKENPIYMSELDIINGFYSYLTEIMPKSHVDKIKVTIDHLEKLSNIKELTGLLEVSSNR